MALLDADAEAHASRADSLELFAEGFDRVKATERAQAERATATDLDLVAWKLEEARDQALHSATERLVASGDGAMSPDSFATFRKQLGNAISFDDGAAKVGEMARRHSKTASALAVTAEPGPYGEHSPHSYFRDCALAVTPADSPFAGHDVRAAHERLARHLKEVRHAINVRSEYGKRAEAALVEATRSSDVAANKRSAEQRMKELRAGVGTGGGATVVAAAGGAAFVTPEFLDSQTAFYFQRKPFVNSVTQADLPAWGMEAYIPAFFSDASVLPQTEALAVTETDPSAEYLTGAIETLAGLVTISQQLFDRSGGPDGYSYDMAVGKQLAIDLGRQQDLQALNAAIAAGGTITYNGSFALAGTSGVGGFVDKLANAKYVIRGTAGGYLEPTSVFFTPERWEWLAGWADSGGRPIILPYPLDSGPRQYGDTGQEWGGLHVYTDPNIPNYGTTNTDQVVVADESEVYFLRSPQPMYQCFPQTDALTLQVVCRLYSYSTCIVRHSNAAQTINGTAFAPVSF